MIYYLQRSIYCLVFFMANTFISRLFSGKKETNKSSFEKPQEIKESVAFTGPAAIHNPDSRWDRQNKPVEYILGASPGFAQFAQGDEKLTTTGLGRKIAKASRMGFDFAIAAADSLTPTHAVRHANCHDVHLGKMRCPKCLYQPLSCSA